MRDPSQYFVALTIAAGACAIVVLAFGRPSAGTARLNTICVAALAAGVVSGGWFLRLPITWPPTNGLGRLVCVLLPAVSGIEILTRVVVVPQWCVRCLRFALALLAGFVLLYGSVYLATNKAEWSAVQAAIVLFVSGGLLAAVWQLLLTLLKRSGGAPLLLSLAGAALGSGVAVMLAGYLTGGAAAVPLAGALIGCSLAAAMRKLPADAIEGVAGVGVIALFGLIFVGRFFGHLLTGRALVLLLAPLLCWVTELPIMRRQPAWRIALLRLLLVAIPLLVVLALAKRDFDRDMRPLLVITP